MNAILFSDVSFSYKNTPALKNVDFSVEKGELVGVFGSNGCGKSTLAYCINGLIPHEIPGKMSGKVEILGKNIREKKIGQDTGLVFQSPEDQLFSTTAGSEIRLSAKNKKSFEKAVRLTGTKKLLKNENTTLSGGEKQKIAIASVLARDPEILIFDEPTSELDYPSSLNILSLVKKIHKQKKTVVLIEQMIEETIDILDRAIIMHRGKIIMDDEPQKVFANKKLDEIGVRRPQVTKLFELMGSKNPPTNIKEAFEKLKKCIK